jgi:hypothetical protein
MTSESHPRFFQPTLGKLLALVLALEGVLFFTNWFHWTPKGWTVLTALAAVGVFLTGMLLRFVLAFLFSWRFQFNLRLLLTLTVVMAIPASWLAVEMKKASEQRKAIDAASFGIYESKGIQGSEPEEPEWLLRLLGKDFFLNVIDLYFGHQGITDANLKSLEGLDGLQQLDLSYNEITDTGITYLNGLAQLQSLSLECTAVADVGLRHLRGLTNLQKLKLMNTKLTDSGLQHLQSMNQLQHLDLRYNDVTDAGLGYLTMLKDLQLLRLTGTRVTDNGVKRLQQTLPNCKIER